MKEKTYPKVIYITDEVLREQQEKAAKENELNNEPFARIHENEYRQLVRLETVKEFQDVGLMLEYFSPGLVRVHGKFIVSLTNRKWKVQGKNTWYRYKDAKCFVTRFTP